MTEPFAQSAAAQSHRRSPLVPGLIALAATAIAVLIGIHFFPATTVNIEHLRTDVIPTHTVFAPEVKLLKRPEQAEDVLYIASSLRIDNQLRGSIFLDGFSLTLTDVDGAQLTEPSVSQADAPSVAQSFPQLQPFLAAPLKMNTMIEAGKATSGTLVFALRIPHSLWEARKSAVIKVDLYHQPSLYLTIPKP